VITAAITFVITAIAGLFGIAPGAWTVGVAIGVKVVLVLLALYVAWRVNKKKQAAAAGGRPTADG
jgi:uncharacterized membrane protein